MKNVLKAAALAVALFGSIGCRTTPPAPAAPSVSRYYSVQPVKPVKAPAPERSTLDIVVDVARSDEMQFILRLGLAVAAQALLNKYAPAK